MLKRILLSLLILITPAVAQVSVTVNQPGYGWTGYPNSQRQMFALITNGITNKVNWCVTSGSATLDGTFGTVVGACVNNTIPTINVTWGSATGTCTLSPAAGSGGGATYTVTSTTNANVRVTSVDDITKFVDIPLMTCAESPEVHIVPFYQQAYLNQKVDLSALVPFSRTKTGVWSVVSKPVSSTATLSDTTYEDTVFSGNVTGQYVLQFTSNATGSPTGTAIVFVDSASTPSYAVNPPDGAKPVPCTVDSTAFSTVIDVGPTQSGGASLLPYYDPTAPQAAGTILRLHNEDTGTNPTTYVEGIQIASTGTATHPVWLCGVPNSLGYLPHISGLHANWNANTNTAFGAAWPQGPITAASLTTGGTYAAYPGNGVPAYIGITGIYAGDQIVNNNEIGGSLYPGNPAITGISRTSNIATITFASNGNYCSPVGAYISVTGVTGSTNTFNIPTGSGTYGIAATSCGANSFSYPNTGINESGNVSAAHAYFIYASFSWNIHSGGYAVLIGNHVKNVRTGIYFQDNANQLWGGITKWSYVSDNFIEDYADPVGISQLNHAMYIQGDGYIIQRNHIGQPNTGGQGDCIKWRGVYGKIRYNWMESGCLRTLDLVEVQSGAPFVDPAQYIPSIWGASSDPMGISKLTGWEEDFFHGDLVYGNFSQNSAAAHQVHYAFDNPLSFPSFTYRFGELNYYNNTNIDSQYIFQNDGNALYYGILTPRFYMANNEFWSSGGNNVAINSDEQFIGIHQTNLYNSNNGGISVNSSYAGGNWGSGGALGWQSGCPYACQWNLSNPVSFHQYGLTNPNFIQTATNPINNATGIPVIGSAAEGAATTLVGEANNNPVRWMWNTTNDQAVLRTRISGATPLDIGATDFNGTPSANTPTFSPVAGSYGGTQTVTISTTSGGAIICYNTTGAPATNGVAGCTTGTLYTTPVTVSASETLYAVAGGTGFLDSAVGSAAYTINGTGATPTFSPGAGSYAGTQNVTISSSSSGAVICYNTTGSPATNGSTGCTTGTLYTTPVSVSTSETLYAVAGGTAYLDSSVGSAAYTITAGAGGSVTSGNIKRTGHFVNK